MTRAEIKAILILITLQWHDQLSVSCLSIWTAVGLNINHWLQQPRATRPGSDHNLIDCYIICIYTTRPHGQHLQQITCVGHQLFWWTAIWCMSISFNITDRPQESHGAVLDPQTLSCSVNPLSRSRTSIAEVPAWTMSPQNRHVIRRTGQIEAWCCTCHRQMNRWYTTLLRNVEVTT